MSSRSFFVALALVVCAGCGRSSDEDHLEAMAAEHRGDAPLARPAARALVTAPIDAGSVVYANLEGIDVRGFLAQPRRAADEPSPPGVLVIHEWWGLNDNIRSMARQLAAEGYAALAVDLYGGRVAEEPALARELMQAAQSRPVAIQANLRQAHAYLVDRIGAPRTGSIGWCFGGGVSLEAALLLPGELDAAVVYYGRVVTDRKRLERLDTPVLGLFGGADRGIPVESVRAFEAALRELGKTAEIHIYPGAAHAFANPSGTRYDAAAAEDAWARTLAFLKQTLE